MGLLYSKGYHGRDGVLIKGIIPHDMWQRAVKDPSEAGSKFNAATLDEDINTKYLKGSREYGGVKQFLRKPHLKKYYGNLNGFTRGTLGAALGISGLTLMAEGLR